MTTKKVTYKDFEKYDRVALSLYNKYVLNPLGRIISIPIINHTNIKPYQITIAGLLLSISSAFLFFNEHFILGALIFQLAVIFDLVDGYVARIKKTGSVFGIVLDTYCDQIRVFLNVLVFIILYYNNGNYIVSISLGIFLFINILEQSFNKILYNIENFWRNIKPKMNKVDCLILRAKDALEKKGLKLLLLHYHERVFLVLFLGPIINKMELFTLMAIIIGFLSINIKILLDIAIIKDKILNDRPAYLSYTTGIKNNIGNHKLQVFDKMIEEIKIENKLIGQNQEPFIIAEAGINHNGDIKLAKKMIIEAKKCGADAIKFQTFTAQNMMIKETVSAEHLEKSAGNESVYDFVKKVSLSREEFRELAELCKKEDIIFLSTAGTPDDVDFLESLDVPAFKVASMDLNNIPLLNHIAKKNKPVLLSTGMGEMRDVARAVKCFKDIGNNRLVVLQCTSRYPTPPEDVNLKVMDILKERFGFNVGFSDHTEGIIIPLAAIARGAVVVEKHYTLDKKMEGPDQRISADPEELTSIVKGSKAIFKALGTGVKKPFEFEKKIKSTFCRSVVSNRDIRKGEILNMGAISFKRPGVGIPPNEVEKVIGKKAKKDIPEDTLIISDDLE